MNLSEHWFSYDDLEAFEKKIRNFEKRCETEAAESLARKIDSVEIEDKVEGTKNSKIIKDNTLNEERLSMEKCKTRGPTCSHEIHGMESDKKIYVEWNDVAQPVGPGGRSLRTFLGTVVRNTSKLPIDISVWNKIPKHLIEDVWDFIKRKYDVGELEKKWIMKEISLKSGSITSMPCEGNFSSRRRSEVNRKNKGVQKIFHCAGTQTFADIYNAETVASKYDIYSQVLGEDKPSRVRGLGTGPTPATLWGRSTDILKDKNKKLGDCVKDLEEMIAKLERTDSKFQEENDSVDGGVAPKESASVTKQDAHSLTSKRVKLLDMYGSQVAIDIVMSTDPTIIVMGRPIGQDFCEVDVLLANKPDSPVFIKDHNRKTMKDTIGRHILWFLQYVQLDFKRQVGDQD
ncbi:hypothetical protein Taro_037368 [Colocasia esculenta]|uniref:Transposase n=1 Tax=Colocasia esculenta TaxID=4460 RepID=A0A843WJ29_COLES|nr:hypothetical protein [Colocasia esculenta]